MKEKSGGNIAEECSPVYGISNPPNKNGDTKMFRWKNKVNKKLRKGNTTPGNTKGENCHANALDKTLSRKSRSYKKKEYHGFLIKKARIRKDDKDIKVLEAQIR